MVQGEIVLSKKQIATVVLALWLSIIDMYMLLIMRFDFEIFFVLGFIGILVIVEILEPRYVKPGILKHKNYLIAVGTVCLGAILIQAVLIILGSMNSP
jgi:hypothetical protein